MVERGSTLDILLYGVHGEAGADMCDRPIDIAFNQAKQHLRRRGETFDAELAVQEHRRDLGVLQQVLDVAVGPTEFLDPVVQFRVDGVQLFVDRGQLLPGRFQLLIRGLQFLVDRG